MLTESASLSRSPEVEIDAQFLERWSRRSLSERPLSSSQIAVLFEAARWAPSASNLQPWLFVYVQRPEALAKARTLLNERNQRWASRAPLLIFVFARKRHPETGQPIRTALFDTGAAWLSLALQAHKLGLSTRAMGGIRRELTYEAFGVPGEDFESVVAIAVGYPAEADALPPDLQAKEHPNTRKSTREFVFEEKYQPR